jgi:hypothetical protein
VLGALALYPIARADRLAAVVAAVGAAACLVAAVGLVFRLPLVLAWGIALVGAEYALQLRLGRDVVDGRAPLVAAALVLVAELAYASTTATAARLERRVVVDEILFTFATAATAGLAAGILLVVSGTATSGLALEAIGATAAVAAVALVVRAVRRELSRS